MIRYIIQKMLGKCNVVQISEICSSISYEIDIVNFRVQLFKRKLNLLSSIEKHKEDF